MSTRPGIGKQWLEKWETDVYPNDYVVINGYETRPPKYYDKLMNRKNSEIMEEIKMNREMNGRKNYEDNTDERLKAKEAVAKAKVNQLKRKMNEY